MGAAGANGADEPGPIQLPRTRRPGRCGSCRTAAEWPWGSTDQKVADAWLYSQRYSPAGPPRTTAADTARPCDQAPGPLTRHPRSSLNPRVRGSSSWRRTNEQGPGKAFHAEPGPCSFPLAVGGRSVGAREPLDGAPPDSGSSIRLMGRRPSRNSIRRRGSLEPVGKRVASTPR